VPKRTNDFQALIALVERQLAASGVRVVESEMLADRLTGELREVDVCVHATVSGKDVTLALECRDHKRKADQIWIDTLRGKYAAFARASDDSEHLGPEGTAPAHSRTPSSHQNIVAPSHFVELSFWSRGDSTPQRGHVLVRSGRVSAATTA